MGNENDDQEQFENAPSSEENAPKEHGIPYAFLADWAKRISDGEGEKIFEANIIHPITTSGENIVGTIRKLSNNIDRIQTYTNDVNVVQTDESIPLLMKEVESIKNDVLPQLEETKNSLDDIKKFLKENSSFLITSISAEGKIPYIEGELSSISRRIEQIEGKKNINWNKAATIASIVVALLSVSFACLSLIVAAYVALR